jgi:hypothetical protein
VNNKTAEVIQRKRNKNESLWRVSSTLFGHIQSDVVLEPLHHFGTETALRNFPPMRAGEQVFLIIIT